ncbi:MAG: hypothetical protein KTV16_16775 [Acidimicrobiia bacterium]|nr:hypothetical protein [Acidimicrobiia bacterium]
MSQKIDWETLDLVQHQIVSAVATQQKQRPKVCFKGGTLLRACLRMSDSSFRVGDDWQSLVFDSVDAKLPYLEDDWATMTTNEMISGRVPRFNDMILNILDEVTAMPRSPRTLRVARRRHV